MSLRSALKTVLINLLVLAVGAVAVEAAFRAIIDGYSDEREFRATQPAPYRDAEFFSAEFIAESFRQPGGWRPLQGTNAILPHDFAGEYFTVKNGIRRTTDVPSDAVASIYLFGGSTIYNSEVPDAQTVASHLQRQLVGAGFGAYRVVNFGVTSVSTRQQLERLEVEPIGTRDIVVFYDGVNDVLQGVLYGNSGDTIYGNDRSRPLRHRILYRLSKDSVAARHLLTSAGANYEIANLSERVTAAAARYAANLEKAEHTVRQRGARFAHFLQPTLYSLAQRGAYENELMTFGFVPIQAEQAFTATYPHFRKLVEHRAQQGLADFDLTTVFDGLDEPIYLDGWHVNHRGNEIVAEQILAGLVAAQLVD